MLKETGVRRMSSKHAQVPLVETATSEKFVLVHRDIVHGCRSCKPGSNVTGAVSVEKSYVGGADTLQRLQAYTVLRVFRQGNGLGHGGLVAQCMRATLASCASGMS